MKLKSETRVIDDLEFTATQLTPLAALDLLPTLGKVIGPAFEKLSSATVDDSLASLAPAFGAVDASSVKPLREALFKCVRVKLTNPDRIVVLSSDEIVNEVFAGSLQTMLKVLIFAVEINYADFFGFGRRPE